MIYLIPGDKDIIAINKYFMGTSNPEIDIDYVLDKIRRAINEYMDIPTMVAMVSDTMLGVTTDTAMVQAFMTNWLRIIIRLQYYIVKEDIMLPFIEIKLQYNDICAVTAAEE